MDEEIISAIKIANSYLSPTCILNCVDFILKDAAALNNVKRGEISALKQRIRNFLKLGELSSGASVTSKKFWMARGWTEEEANLKITGYTSKIDYKSFSPYSISCQKYEGLTLEEKKSEVSKRRPSSIEYWKTKTTNLEEAEKMLWQHQQKAGVSANTKNLWRKDKTSTQVGYWTTRGFSLDEAKKLVAKRQDTKSLKFYITRDGIISGSLTYLKRLKTVGWDLHNVMRISIIRSILEFRKNRFISVEDFLKINLQHKKAIIKTLKGHASKESLVFLKPLFDFFNQNNIECLIGLRGKKELELKRNLKQKFRYDFCVPSLKIILEYDGFYYHSNPSLDEEKDLIAKKNGYKIFRLKGFNPNMLRKDTIKENFSVLKSIFEQVLDSSFKEEMDNYLTKSQSQAK